jgi:hypothetical protein
LLLLYSGRVNRTVPRCRPADPTHVSSRVSRPPSICSFGNPLLPRGCCLPSNTSRRSALARLMGSSFISSVPACLPYLRTEYTAPSHSATASSTSPSSDFISAAAGSTTERRLTSPVARASVSSTSIYGLWCIRNFSCSFCLLRMARLNPCTLL